MEIDHEEGIISPFTRDGSVDRSGRKAMKDTTGGWRSAILLLGLLCGPHSQTQVAILCISLYLIALGHGATDPCLAALGSDQFDEEDSKERKSKASFYSYYYVAFNLGCLLAETILADIETSGKWILGFWICTCSALFSFLLLLSGTPRYRHLKPTGNAISILAQVVVASLRKKKFQLPTNEEDLYEFQGDNDGVTRMCHTDDFK
ncbi:hypothetical protein PIB30_069738 [Stylosanthes scabra]|uniref:Uncharacterized protein n=1 Tax=Stylosanthes scabra TaxID=79078 RepID=A0ABU6QMU4_9FABA|nr:hypothetical protein [Stylosanthes scabra]